MLIFLKMMAKGAIVLTSNNCVNPGRRTQAQILAKTLGKLGRKYKHQIYAIGTTLIVASQTKPAGAFGLFDPAQIALTCMFGVRQLKVMLRLTHYLE